MAERQFSPEEVRILVALMSQEPVPGATELGTLDERSALLAQQMEQAQAMGHPRQMQTMSPKAATLNGMGNVLGALTSGLQQYGIDKQQQGLLAQKDAVRKRMDTQMTAQQQERNRFFAKLLSGGRQTPVFGSEPSYFDYSQS